MKIKDILIRIANHAKDFYFVWILIIGIIIAAFSLYSSQWELAQKWLYILLAIFTVYLLCKPMGVVYGLIGTSGAIRVFFINFIIISGVFAGIYYHGFFRDAGITYDVNQPYIAYNMFVNTDKNDSTVIAYNEQTIIKSSEQNHQDTIRQWISEEMHFQKVAPQFVIQNTIMTSLMQEPAEFFAISSTYNQGINISDNIIDQNKSEIFHWLLILQTFISWIFFGVFISILYNKFRYES